MIETIRIDLLEVLAKAEPYLKFLDARKLRELSDHTIRNAGIYQDQDSLRLAVVIYALSKMIERMPTDTAPFTIILREAHARLELDKEDEYRESIGKLLDSIGHADTAMGLYVEEVLTQARIKKGSKLFAQGISLGQSAHLLGITKWELMHYIGKTSMSEELPQLDMRARLAFTRKIFFGGNTPARRER